MYAMELGESLRDIALDAVVSSDLQRVVDTVQLAVGSRQSVQRFITSRKDRRKGKTRSE